MDAKTERPPDADRQQGVRVSFDGGRLTLDAGVLMLARPRPA
jgi:hypothetical protein